MKVLIARKELSCLRGQKITAMGPVDAFYLDMRWYGFAWYDELPWLERHIQRYKLECQYLEFSARTRTPRSSMSFKILL